MVRDQKKFGNHYATPLCHKLSIALTFLLMSLSHSLGQRSVTSTNNFLSHPRPVTRGGEALLEKFSTPLEKFVGHSLKLLDTVQNIWAPLRKLFAPPGVPGWLRACLTPTRASKINPCPPHAHSSAGSRNPRELISPAQNLLPEQRRTVLAHTRNEERAILLRKKSIRDTIH